jgi:DNA-binding HxlR family transcriptional regulator
MTETLSLLGHRNGDRRPAETGHARPTREDLEMIDRTRAARDLLASKWKVDLLYLLARGVHRYSRLYDNLKGASKKMLTDSLRGLERDGFVERMVFPEVPVRVEYSLTQLGWSVTQLLIDLADWAGEYLTDVEDARRRYDQAKSETDAAPPPGWRGLDAAA